MWWLIEWNRILTKHSSPVSAHGTSYQKSISDVILLVHRFTCFVLLFATCRPRTVIWKCCSDVYVLCCQVLIFLDSHCEVNVGWLEPLLSHVKSDRRNVAIPVIDIINQDSFALQPSPLVRGGFNWGLFYRWDPVYLRENDSFTAPIKLVKQFR